ncbi:MAG: TrkH family potassium uptake protein [Bacteroidales bacterium]
MINKTVIIHLMGLLLIIEGVFLLLSALVAWSYDGYDFRALLLSAFISAGFGGILWVTTKNAKKTIAKREGYIIVSLVWIIFSLFGALPFIMSGAIPSYTDAFFETISGFTTTGASILDDIEALPKGLLFWRSLTQWLGGMGIIVLSLAILPIFGFGGMQLFVAEVPGPTPDKIHPRVKETAKRLWGIYVLFTLIETLMLKFGGMTWFDAINHSFATMATGGYSTKQASIAYYSSPYIQYTITFFMLLAGTNFALSYQALHLRFRSVFRNEELRYYLGFILGFTALITAVLIFQHNKGTEIAFREAIFQVVSIITTTGFATTDYLLWVPFLSFIIFSLMFFGGSAGSTGGGIKIVRVMLLMKNSLQELKRIIHPNAVIPVRMNKKSVAPQIITNILAFVVFYMLILIIGSVIISIMGYDMETSVGAVAATLGNIGPGIGAVGPAANYAHFPVFGKWFLSFLMLMGRLELFTVLVLFSPALWKK